MRHLAEQSKVLKTRKIREAELAAQRARITKVEYDTPYYLLINYRSYMHHTLADCFLLLSFI